MTNSSNQQKCYYLFSAWHLYAAMLCLSLTLVLSVALVKDAKDAFAVALLGVPLAVVLIFFLFGLHRGIAFIQIDHHQIIFRTGLWIFPKIAHTRTPGLRLNFSRIEDIQLQGPAISENTTFTRAIGNVIRIIGGLFLRKVGLTRKSGLESFVHLRIQSTIANAQTFYLPNTYNWNAKSYACLIEWLRQQQIPVDLATDFDWRDSQVSLQGKIALCWALTTCLVILVLLFKPDIFSL